jgi:hypothetical protein
MPHPTPKERRADKCDVVDRQIQRCLPRVHNHVLNTCFKKRKGSNKRDEECRMRYPKSGPSHKIKRRKIRLTKVQKTPSVHQAALAFSSDEEDVFGEGHPVQQPIVKEGCNSCTPSHTKHTIRAIVDTSDED